MSVGTKHEGCRGLSWWVPSYSEFCILLLWSACGETRCRECFLWAYGQLMDVDCAALEG